MTTELEPKVGHWYRDLESRRYFEVVAIDEDAATVEIQYFESEVAGIDIDNWYDMFLQEAAEPEDWSGPYDDLIRDDFGDIDEALHPESWNSPLDDFEPEQHQGFDYE